MRKLGYLIAIVVLPTMAAATETVLKDPESGKTIAVIVDCNSCKTPSKSPTCVAGQEKDGFNDGAACGECLLDANYGVRIAYSNDLLIVGRLLDEKGQPLKNKFVKIFLPNNWGFRTRSGEDGSFRVVLGATTERKGKTIQLALGDRTMPKDSKAPYYAMYMMPEGYAACGDKKAEKNPAKKPASK